MKNKSLSLRQFLELNGHLVQLKRLDVADLDAYWTLMEQADIESAVLTGTTQLFTKTAVQNYLQKIATATDRIDFLIYTKTDHSLIGEVVINDVCRALRSANIRISLFNTKDFGKGYGSEAMLLALNYGFGMMNLHRIELGVFPFNDRAIHVYEKLGFQKEGIRRDGAYFHHQYYDEICMSLLENEFKAKYLSKKQNFQKILNSI